MKDIILGLLAFALILIVPILIIWSLNTLFSLGIAYTIKTWVATLILTVTLAATGGSL